MAFPNGKHLGIWAALLAEVLILTILTSSFGGPHLFDSTFLTWSNISQVIRALSFIAIMAVGQFVVIISRGVDLSGGLVFWVLGGGSGVPFHGGLGGGVGGVCRGVLGGG